MRDLDCAGAQQKSVLSRDKIRFVSFRYMSLISDASRSQSLSAGTLAWFLALFLLRSTLFILSSGPRVKLFDHCVEINSHYCSKWNPFTQLPNPGVRQHTFFHFRIMQCPRCKQCLPRRFWTRGQWINYSPDFNGYSGCKTCSGSGETYYQRPAEPHQQRPAEHFRELEILYDELCKRVAKMRTVADVIERFIFAWMELPAPYRKKLSHYGAVRTAHRLHPIHFVSDRIGSCFDPSNAVYALVLRAICPAVQRMPFNEETLGDICEAWLATGMQSRSPAARHLALGIEGVAAILYVVGQLGNVWSLEALDELGKTLDTQTVA